MLDGSEPSTLSDQRVLAESNSPPFAQPTDYDRFAWDTQLRLCVGKHNCLKIPEFGRYKYGYRFAIS